MKSYSMVFKNSDTKKRWSWRKSFKINIGRERETDWKIRIKSWKEWAILLKARKFSRKLANERKRDGRNNSKIWEINNWIKRR